MVDTLQLDIPLGLSRPQRFLKRGFDVVVSFAGLFFVGWIILIAYILASFDTRQSGFFTQGRVGRMEKLFNVIKIRTMREKAFFNTNVTTSADPRITKLGCFFRKVKIDELPQLINVLKGEMSFVGPRPDVPGFANELSGENRIVLSLRPGITGPATLEYRNEEELLAKQDDPEKYNSEVIYPRKVRLNREYVENYSFRKDMSYIFQTIFG